MIAILTTTINVPYFLDDLCKNIYQYGHNENVIILIIGDKKTPEQTADYLKKTSKKWSIKIDYLDVKKQDQYFKKYKRIYNIFPYNDAIRRLLGNLYLNQFKIDKFIYLDDDNFITKSSGDYIKQHSLVGKKITTNVFYSKNKWPNAYKFLKTKRSMPIFPRGYPWKFRNEDSFKTKENIKMTGKVIVNCGYILGDPDIDASSRIFWNIDVKEIKRKKNIFFKPKNYFPFNDQNTCIDGEYLNLYFKPLSNGRNADIWTSYLFCKIAEIRNELISYGGPELLQIRNVHDNWKDYELEKSHNISTDKFVSILREIKVKNNKNTYKLLKTILIEAEKKLEQFRIKIFTKKINKIGHYQGFSLLEANTREKEVYKYIKKYLNEYSLWLKLIKNFPK